ncbi:type II toxin-antitoxin system prevent-host-death family antitoxin [bacterium]|nr:type II toxin-antitoxin system prevent-host-death family antitoxin [bacterium]RQV94420.1 MAG: type II toxin-antitoxin system prevent-host-death family antitoxin [bacterium]
MKATAKDLRFHSKELLDTVSRGEEVIITLRGKPHAKLIPINRTDKNNESVDNALFGIWKDNQSVKNVDSYIRNLRKGRFQ